MALIIWSDKLSVGVPSIDAQHRSLVETLNRLHEAMMKGNTKDVTGVLLRNLATYTRDHFAKEEAMMSAANYPRLSEHRNHHAALTKQIEEFVARFERGESTVNLQLLSFLRDWLTNHILKEDMAYSPAMKALGMR